jgi:chorismate-pyruvate lyase
VGQGVVAGDRQMTIADRLAMLHFTMQHIGVEMAGLQDVEVATLDPVLRGLLFTDGTVTRALEVQTLSRVAVDTVDQSSTPPPVQVARQLEVEGDVECLRRRVVMKIAGTASTVWAESYIVPERLPADFVELLDSTPHGIGGSLQQLRLESRRELLWFKLGPPPRWASAPTPSATALIRAYRIISGGLPALLISEAFAVEVHSSRYRLVGWTDVATHLANGSALSPAVGRGPHSGDG